MADGERALGFSCLHVPMLMSSPYSTLSAPKHTFTSSSPLSFHRGRMWGKFAESQAKSQVTESLYEVKTGARTQQTTELMQVRHFAPEATGLLPACHENADCEHSGGATGHFVLPPREVKLSHRADGLLLPCPSARPPSCPSAWACPSTSTATAARCPGR